MPRVSKVYAKNGISRARFKELQGIAMQYREMKARETMRDRLRAPETAGNTLNRTPEMLKIQAIEAAATAVDESIAPYILRGVCDRESWETMQPPIGRRAFYERYRKFFIELDKRA